MHRLLLFQTAALAAGFLIDALLGDPYSLPHPVKLMGRLIAFLDRKLRRGNSHPQDVGRGALLVVLVCLASVILPGILLFAAWKISPWLYFALSSLFCWQLLAARQLAKEADKVRRHLEAGNVEGARKAVSFIVGRDTDVLDEPGICRAAVETVAENASDGVVAPLFWMLLFGTPGGFFYKAVNTMDSMVGYRNEKYLTFGRAAAKLDDFMNFLPSRLCALLMIAVCPLLGLDRENAWRIFRRDRMKHASPNSAQTESVCAGALRIRLAGDAVYGGIVHKKDYLGDPIREIEAADIRRAVRLMYAASLLMLLLCLLLRTGVILCL